MDAVPGGPADGGGVPDRIFVYMGLSRVLNKEPAKAVYTKGYREAMRNTPEIPITDGVRFLERTSLVIAIGAALWAVAGALLL